MLHMFHTYFATNMFLMFRLFQPYVAAIDQFVNILLNHAFYQTELRALSKQNKTKENPFHIASCKCFI
jgi:hypothetical protein